MEKNPDIELITDLFKVADIFKDAGMTDPKKYPVIYTACSYLTRHGVGKPLIDLLKYHPNLFEKAKRYVENRDRAKQDNPFLPYPEGKDIPKIKGEYALGYVNPSLDIAGIDPLDFTYGMFIIGAIGAGKTYPCLRIIKQMLSVPKEERGFNIVIIQVVKRDADFLTKSHPNLKIIEWKDLRYNLWEIESWDSQETKISYSSNIFSAVNYFMSLSKPLLRCTINRTLQKFEKMKLKKPMTFSELIKQIDTAAEVDMGLESYKSKEVKENLKFRFTDFINTGNVLDCEHGFTIEDVWSKEDIILNVMDEQNDYIYRTFIIDMLMGMQRYHSRHEMRPPRLKTLFVFDECRSLFKAKNDQNDFDPDRYYEIFTTTGRACGIGRMCLAQEPQSVSSWLTDNNAIAAAFPIAGESLEYLPKLLNLTDEQVSYIFKLPKYGACIVRDRRYSKPYLLEVPSDLEIPDFTLDESKYASKQFTEPLHKLLLEKSGQAEEQNKLKFDDLPGDQQKVLKTLKAYPFLSYTELRTQTKLGNKMIETVASLTYIELIEEKIYEAAKGKNTRYFALTETAQDLLKMSNNSRIPPRLFLHTMYEHWVCEYLRSQQFNGLMEFTGKNDIGENQDNADNMLLRFTDEDGNNVEIAPRIDVYCPELKTAFEITREDLRHLRFNVFKCFHHFKNYVDKLVIVCETKQILDDAIALINKIYGDESQKHIFDRIELMLIRSIRKNEENPKKT